MMLRTERPSIPRIVLLGAGLVVVSALVLLSAPIGYRTGDPERCDTFADDAL